MKSRLLKHIILIIFSVYIREPIFSMDNNRDYNSNFLELIEDINKAAHSYRVAKENLLKMGKLEYVYLPGPEGYQFSSLAKELAEAIYKEKLYTEKKLKKHYSNAYKQCKKDGNFCGWFDEVNKHDQYKKSSS